MSQQPALIQIKGLSKHYVMDEPVLDQISMTVNAGEICGIIGRSGAGKSTLVRCLNGLEKPSSGHIYIQGVDIAQLTGRALRKARRGIGMVFQHFNLLSSRTVAQNVALPLELSGESKALIRPRVSELLALVGLTHKADAYPSELSGGQKQRIGIARALALQPSILLCDEPTSALDPEATEQILSLLSDLNQRLGITILIISHEMQVVRDIATQVAVLEKGQIVEIGSTYEVFAFPKTQTTKRFIGATMAHELPAPLAQKLRYKPQSSSYPVIRVIQTQQTIQFPVIALLQQQFAVSAQVLHGRVDYIGSDSLSVLTLSLPEAQTKLVPILNWLSAQELHAEVIGYVA